MAAVVLAPYLLLGNVAPAGAATLAPTNTITPNSGSTAGGNDVVIAGSFRTTNRGTTVTFGASTVTRVTCAATTCTVRVPAGAAGTVNVTVNDGNGVATLVNGYTYRPTISSISPTTGPSAGGTSVRIDGAGFVPGATTVRFGATAATNVSCSDKRCTATAPAGLGAAPVSVVVNGIESTVNRTFTYTAPVPAITSITPGTAPLNVATPVTVAGTGFFPGQTFFTFGTAAEVPGVCASTTSCTATVAPVGTAGTLNVTVRVGTQTSAAVTFAVAPASAPAITAIAPTSGATTGGYPVTVTGTNMVGAVVRFGATAAAAVSPCTATSCVVTAPAGALGTANVTAAVGPSVSNAISFSYVPALQSPPVAPHSITAFPQRDFVSVAEFTPDAAPYTIEVRSANGTLRSRATNVQPVQVDGVWTMEVNHPGGVCWEGVTPDLAAGDQIRVISAAGVTSQTRVAGVTATPGAVSPLNALTVVVRGRAVDVNGNQLPTDQVEHRFVNPDFPGRRTLRADVTGQGDGTLVFDGAGNYVATYVLSGPDIVALALAAESRGLWLGADPAAGVEMTIFEVGSLVTAGPQAPCSAPLEPDTFVPTVPTGFTGTVTLDNVHLTWNPATDNRAVDHYDVFRDNVAIATVFGTVYDDLHVTAGSHTWKVRAVDTSGNVSVFTPDFTGNPSANVAPDLSVGLTSSPALFTVGTPGTVALTATNVGTSPTAGLITLTLSLPAGLTATSFSSTEASLSCTIPVGGASVTCTTSNPMAVGAAFSFTTTVAVASAAFPSATVTGSAALAPAVSSPGDPVTVNNTAERTITTNVAAVTVNDPPRVDRAIVAFPARDYIGGEGYVPGAAHTVQIIRNSVVIASARGVLADAEGLLDINHLAPVCWDNVTPHLTAGDVVRIIDPAGIADQTTIANVVTLYSESLGGGVIRVRGTAQDAAGNPLPIGDIEQRIIASSADPFDKNDRRSLRADSAGQSDGILVYDAPGSINWTATYTGLSAHDVNLALTSEARIQWLGRDPLLGNELTIFENGPAVARGPAAGCPAPADPAPLPPTSSVSVTSSHSGSFSVGQPNAEYRVRVRNQGDAAASNVFVIIDLPAGILPKGLGAIAFSGGSWLCDISGSRITCARSGPLAPGGDETITVGVDVSAAAIGTVVNQVEVSGSADRDPSDNWATDATVVIGSSFSSDLGISLTHTGVFTQGVPGTYTATVRNFGTSTVAGPITVTDTVPVGFTFNSAGSVGWTCSGTTTITCTRAIALAPGASVVLPLVFTPGATSVGTRTNQVTVVNLVDANPADNTASDVTVVNPNPSEPPTSGVSIIAFPSRDFVSAEGFQPTDGPITFQVWRNGVLQSTSGPVALTPEGIAEVNHPGGGCWVGNTPDIRPGDQVRAITAAGVGHQTTVANVAVTGTVRVGTSNVFEVHGIAHNGAGAPLSLDQLEVRIRADSGTFVTNGRNTLRAPLDGTLSYDAPGSSAFTATFTVNAADVTAVTGAETRIHWLGRQPLSGAEATIFEFGTGVAGGPSAPCTAPAPVAAPLIITAAVNNGDRVRFTVRNTGAVAATGVRLAWGSSLADRNGVISQSAPIGPIPAGATVSFTVRFNVAVGTPVRLFAYVVADQADLNANDSAIYFPFTTTA